MLGWLVAVIDVGQFLPQVRRAVLLRSNRVALRGLSPWTWSIASIQAVAWVIYGLGTRHWAIGIPNVLIAPMSLGILVVVLRARRGSGDSLTRNE